MMKHIVLKQNLILTTSHIPHPTSHIPHPRIFLRKTLFLILTSIFLLSRSNAQVDTFICDNGGFEQGFQYYTGSSGFFEEGSKTCTPTQNGYPIAWIPRSMPTANRFEIVYGGTDPLIGIPRTKFGSSSLMLNNRYGHLDLCDGDKDANRIQKRFKVTEENRHFAVWFAAILENPDGHGDSQPWFSISCDLVPEQTLCFDADMLECDKIRTDPLCIFEKIDSVDWACHKFNIPSNKIGQIATLSIIASDCGCGKHFGYAYIDGICEDCNNSAFGNSTLYDQPMNNLGYGIEYYSCDGENIRICGKYDLPSVCGNWILESLTAPGFNIFNVSIDPASKRYCFDLPKSNFSIGQCRDLFTTLIFKSNGVSLPPVNSNTIEICYDDYKIINIQSQTGQCQNNNTTNVMSDDYYYVQLDLINIGNHSYIIQRQLNNPYPNEPGPYTLKTGNGSAVLNLGPFIIQEGPWTLTVNVDGCLFSFQITPPAFCSATCQDFNNLSIRNVTCYPNNTWTFDLTVPTGGSYTVTDLSNNSFTNCSSGAIPCTINGGNISTACKRFNVQFTSCPNSIYIDVCPPKPCNVNCGLEVYRKDLYCNQEGNMYYFTLDVKSAGNFLCYKTLPGGAMGPLPSGPLGPYSSDITLTVYECNNAACNCPAPSCFKSIFIPKPDCPRLNYRNKNQQSNLNVEDLRVFPNPSNTGIITLQSSNENIRFELWSIDQKLILTHQKLEQSKELDLRHLPSGLYFIKYFISEEKMKVLKFILQH